MLEHRTSTADARHSNTSEWLVVAEADRKSLLTNKKSVLHVNR